MPGEGWHADPDGLYQLRYHNGDGWTAHVFHNGDMLEVEAPEAAQGWDPTTTTGQPNDDQTRMGWVQYLVREYAAACTTMLDALGAALEPANKAIGALDMSRARPQHEISIAHFAGLAEQFYQDFLPPYRLFEDAVRAAKLAGIRLSKAGTDLDLEMEMFLTIGERVSEVAAAIEYLRVSYGPTPQAFLDGIARANDLINTTPTYGEPGFMGTIYSDIDQNPH